MSNEENGKHTPKKDRYWSVMLVGDRGRVIPFRHFKGIALSVCCISLLLLVAVLVMAFLYMGQGKKLASLENELQSARTQNSKLRDEKDLYLTKLMVTQKQEMVATRKPKVEPPAEPVKSKPEETKEPDQAETKVEPAAPAKRKKAPAKPPAPKVRWKADIRRFSVSYDAKLEVLKAQFRVYNVSKPKRRLSGRGVVVFKMQDDPPAKWMPVPRVQLNSGEPSGTRGQSFRVKNYFTMRFRAYRQKVPVLFNTATVYVFGKDGQLLASKDFAFKIETPPQPEKRPSPSPPAVKKEQPTPAPPPAVKRELPAPTPAPPAATPLEEKVPAASVGQENTGTVAPAPAPGAADQLPAASTPPAQPTPDPEISKPPDIPTQTETPSGSETTETPSGSETTETVPQPKVEGETR